MIITGEGGVKKLLKLMWLSLQGLHICQHNGCLNVGMQCHLTAYTDDYKPLGKVYWYCAEHCHEEGFCWVCGEFWGGVEAFEFSKSSLCENCRSELDDESEPEEYEEETV